MTIVDLFSSALATAVAEVVTLPICTLKTNYQNTSGKTIPEVIQDLYQRGGLKSFYQASVPAIGSQVWSTSSKYFFYRSFEKSLNLNPHLHGMMAGILSTLISHPIDVIKIHLQMNQPFLPELKSVGPKIFYRGYSKTFLKASLSSSLYFPLYDKCFAITSHPVSASLISASIATTIMHPVDYLKTRHIYGQKLYLGWDPRLYYRGWTLNMARILPHFTIIMTSIHYFENFWEAPEI